MQTLPESPSNQPDQTKFQYQNNHSEVFKPNGNSFIKRHWKSILLIAFVIIIGFAFWLGLYVGMRVQPRSAISLNKCQENCWNPNEVAGLVGSIGIELGFEKPFVQIENDNCFSIKMPTSKLSVHYVVIPKKDIKDLGDLSDQEQQIVNDCIKIVSEHIQRENLKTYQFTSNGPNYQHVRYLHFHVKSKKE